MQESPNNRMVGQASHIRDVGPHAHVWLQAGSSGGEVYELCETCGSRRVRGGVTGRNAQTAWLGGGEWVGDGFHPTPMPAGPIWGQTEYVNTHAGHEAQSRAVDVVGGTKAGEGDVVKERRALEPGQLAEERGHPVAEPAQGQGEPNVEPVVDEQTDDRRGRNKK